MRRIPRAYVDLNILKLFRRLAQLRYKALQAVTAPTSAVRQTVVG